MAHDEHALWRLFDRLLYDPVQRLVGQEVLLAKIRSVLSAQPIDTVVDVGAGTGAGASLVPRARRYVWLDIDTAKLAAFRLKYPRHLALRSDASALALADRSVDLTLCIALSHHLPAALLEQLFAELARVTRGSLVFVDAVATPKWRSRFLWRVDRGSFPRTLPDLRAAIAERFDIVREEQIPVHHTYALFVATPKERARG